MAKTKLNFRLSDDALFHLGRLQGLWGCDRTAVIERALAEADPSEMDHEERESTQASIEDVITPSAMPEVRGIHPPKRFQKKPGSVSRMVDIPPPSWKTGEKVERKEGRTLTGRSFGPVPKGKK